MLLSVPYLFKSTKALERCFADRFADVIVPTFTLKAQNRKNVNVDFLSRTFLCYLKRFYEGFFKGLHKIFLDSTKKCENKILSYVLCGRNLFVG